MISSRAVMGFEWSFMTIAYITVACRIYVRLVMRKARLFSADYWLILGLLSCQGLLICDTITYSMDAMDDFTIDNVAIRKIRFATNHFFDTGIYFPKFSIIAFYFNLVPISQPKMRIALYCLASLTTSFAVITFFCDWFWCGPDPSINWAKGEQECTSFTSMTLMRLLWSMNFTSEVLNVAYPIPLLATLKMTSTRKKIGLAVVFGLGVITIAVSVGRFVTMVYVDNAISIYIWATAEICISVTVVALTAVRPLLRKLTNLKSTTLLMSEDRSGVPAIPLNRSRKLGGFTGGSVVYWQGTGKSHQRHAEPMDLEGSAGSETELNNINGITLTEHVIVSRESNVNSIPGQPEYSVKV
ncbi:hypothetical protein FOXG_02885 [Fusarium oxysporum f. sp. lycopersici 4287]|uniref:Rhodopsin domain-containing protein n=3 Tax=Fusarium oxysporum TaxID=5507 RepID=A0A0J9UHB1_FUSO4|nr:hypothetical protein FOXG_02885 [Fusarium oxysporum f. sp. lycopersici 4287]EXK33713.1 hypothetical protein FOMG_10964 [Fusarium oxysporum f. sp. melonis 26406]KAJ9421070.1 hypothetical protein QL093DRAFT_2083696 [Fusarium oxysporum]KNA98554.1 hypothetical protein FOXG_02885 [Fusarium oxysporum f. sp. lycopersici 4287]